MPNIFEPHFDEPRDHPGFNCRRARIGRQAGAERLGASVWDVPPGEAAYPYHFHLAEEELLFVLSGEPSLRRPDGWRELEEGEAVSFPVGEEGAHQIVNRTGKPVRLLVVSPNGMPDICVYPDSGKVGAYERRADGGGLREMFRRDDAVDYYEGEDPPAA
jgi:uncharacterized cupin superfamily protein